MAFVAKLFQHVLSLTQTLTWRKISEKYYLHTVRGCSSLGCPNLKEEHKKMIEQNRPVSFICLLGASASQTRACISSNSQIQTREPSHKTCLCFQLFRESPLKMRSFERLSAERETTFYEQLEREMFFKLRVPGINVSTLFCFLRWFRINNAVFVSKTVTSKVRSEPSSRKKTGYQIQ